ncbi:hypothetical protein PQX77_016375 [Marasmius sp. AFHP31]|nr:hypothetical protein PQX77_016375 [Marasmius sp. AFHP31]
MVSSSSAEGLPPYRNESNFEIDKRSFDDCMDLTAPYFVAFYKDGAVKMASFFDLSSAQTLYGNLPPGLGAKTLIHKGKIEESTLKTQGTSYSRDKCERAVKDVGATALNYIVAFHKDGVNLQAAFVDLSSAWMFYGSAVTLTRHGLRPFVKQCEDAGSSEIARSNPIPVCKAPYAVAFNHKGAVSTASFIDLPSARAYYEAVSKEFAKVLMERSPSGVYPLSSCSTSTTLPRDGSMEEALRICIAKISDEKDTTPLRDVRFLVLWHHIDAVRIGFCPNQDAAQAFHDAVGDFWARIVLDRGQSEALELVMHVKWITYEAIRLCKAAVQRSEFPATFDACSYVIGSSGQSLDNIRLAGCMDEQSAESFYDLVPNLDSFKILKHRSSPQELLAFEGDDTLIEKCQYMIRKLPGASGAS